MQRLYEARDALEAQQLRDHLAAWHIDSVVLGDFLSGGVGELSAMNFPSVWLVEDDDLSRARQLLQQFLDEQRSGGADWVCSRCGEHLAGSFELCWQCGAERPDGG